MMGRMALTDLPRPAVLLGLLAMACDESVDALR
jgi:hypothetical protein